MSCLYCDECAVCGSNSAVKIHRLEHKLDSAHAAILHLREMSQRVLDSINPGTKNIVSYEALGNLEHALSATSGYK